MRVHFQAVLFQGKENNPDYDVETFLYMSYWYGATYVVIEGWREARLNDPKVDELLESSNVELLRKYRNGVFHYQKDYYSDKKFMPLIQEGRDVVSWIRSLSEAFSDYFLRWLEKRRT